MINYTIIFMCSMDITYNVFSKIQKNPISNAKDFNLNKQTNS